MAYTQQIRTLQAEHANSRVMAEVKLRAAAECQQTSRTDTMRTEQLRYEGQLSKLQHEVDEKSAKIKTLEHEVWVSSEEISGLKKDIIMLQDELLALKPKVDFTVWRRTL